MESKRVDKINYYLDIAETVASRSTCLRKKYGSVIVNNDEIIATGYNGSPRGRKNCIDLGYCVKKKLFPNVRHAGYDACRSVHAEQNAILSVSRKDMIGSTLYLTGYRTDENHYEKDPSPCLMCRKLIINSEIEKVIVRIEKQSFKIIDVNNWIEYDELLNGQVSY